MANADLLKVTKLLPKTPLNTHWWFFTLLLQWHTDVFKEIAWFWNSCYSMEKNEPSKCLIIKASVRWQQKYSRSEFVPERLLYFWLFHLVFILKMFLSEAPELDINNCSKNIFYNFLTISNQWLKTGHKEIKVTPNITRNLNFLE